MTILEALKQSSRITRAQGTVELMVRHRNKTGVPKLMYCASEDDSDNEIWKVWPVDYPDLMGEDWKPDPDYPPIEP